MKLKTAIGVGASLFVIGSPTLLLLKTPPETYSEEDIIDGIREFEAFNAETLQENVEEEPNPWIKKYNPEACTDRFYTVEIQGVTYSGSTKTANDAYLEMSQKLKETIYNPELDEADRWKRVKNYQEIMEGLNRFRGECEWYGKSVPVP